MIASERTLDGTVDGAMDANTTALLEAARRGEDDALDDLFARVAPRLHALVRLRLGPSLRARLESRDIVQAALLKAFTGLDNLQANDGESLYAWLARIAEHEIRDQADYHRRQRRDLRREASLDEPGVGRLAARVTTLSRRLVLDEERRRLEQALESLSADHREAIMLRALEELPFAEVGRRLGRSADAARMLYARAMTELTLAFQEEP